jgi:hypothetical protein
MASKFGDVGSDTLISGSADVIIDADGGDIIFKDDGTAILTITNDSTNVSFTPNVSGKDLKFKTQGGDVVAMVDSSGDGFIVNRKLFLGHPAPITSDGTVSATSPVSIVLAGAGNVTGTLADADATGELKIIIGLTTGAGSPKVAYKNAAGGTTTKTLTVGTGIILYSIDLSGYGGGVHWMLLGDVS